MYVRERNREKRAQASQKSSQLAVACAVQTQNARICAVKVRACVLGWCRVCVSNLEAASPRSAQTTKVALCREVCLCLNQATSSLSFAVIEIVGCVEAATFPLFYVAFAATTTTLVSFAQCLRSAVIGWSHLRSIASYPPQYRSQSLSPALQTVVLERPRLSS